MVEALLVLVVILVVLLLVLQFRGVSERARAGGEQLAERTRAEAALREMVGPLRTQLEVYQKGVKDLETNRAKQEGSISTQLKELTRQYEGLQNQTHGLVSALKYSGTRGAWGEIQLKRIVELAGMVPYCDFEEQVYMSGSGHDGATRPDLVVRLPGGTSIAVDAKAPGDAFFKANETDDIAEADRLLEQFADSVAAHVKTLSAKAYWDRIQPAPEFVVMFLPVEPMLAAGATKRPRLLEDAFEQRVILTTPTSLIAVLRAAAFGWRQEKIAEDAQHVARLAEEMVRRVLTMWNYFEKVGRGLNSAIDAFNETVGSFEHRVRPSARRLEEHVGNVKELKEIEPIAKVTRSLTADSTAAEASDRDSS